LGKLAGWLALTCTANGLHGWAMFKERCILAG